MRALLSAAAVFWFSVAGLSAGMADLKAPPPHPNDTRYCMVPELGFALPCSSVYGAFRYT